MVRLNTISTMQREEGFLVLISTMQKERGRISSAISIMHREEGFLGQCRERKVF